MELGRWRGFGRGMWEVDRNREGGYGGVGFRGEAGDGTGLGGGMLEVGRRRRRWWDGKF